MCDNEKKVDEKNEQQLLKAVDVAAEDVIARSASRLASYDQMSFFLGLPPPSSPPTHSSPYFFFFHAILQLFFTPFKRTGSVTECVRELQKK
jgi:hypothetical protein